MAKVSKSPCQVLPLQGLSRKTEGTGPKKSWQPREEAGCHILPEATSIGKDEQPQVDFVASGFQESTTEQSVQRKHSTFNELVYPG